MPVTIHIPTALRRFLDEVDELKMESGGTVRSAFDLMISRNSELSGMLFHDDGSLKNFINVFVNDEDIRYEKGLDTPVSSGDDIHIIASIAGG